MEDEDPGEVECVMHNEKGRGWVTKRLKASPAAGVDIYSETNDSPLQIQSFWAETRRMHKFQASFTSYSPVQNPLNLFSNPVSSVKLFALNGSRLGVMKMIRTKQLMSEVVH